MLRNVKIVEKVSTSAVGIGTSVTLYDYEFEEEITYHIVGTTEIDIYGVLTSNPSSFWSYSGESFDEYWLCIGLPLEERGYSICGASLESNFISDYQRIYITQQLPPKTILLHNK